MNTFNIGDIVQFTGSKYNDGIFFESKDIYPGDIGKVEEIKRKKILNDCLVDIEYTVAFQKDSKYMQLIVYHSELELVQLTPLNNETLCASI